MNTTWSSASHLLYCTALHSSKLFHATRTCTLVIKHWPPVFIYSYSTVYSALMVSGLVRRLCTSTNIYSIVKWYCCEIDSNSEKLPIKIEKWYLILRFSLYHNTVVGHLRVKEHDNSVQESSYFWKAAQKKKVPPIFDKKGDTEPMYFTSK